MGAWYAVQEETRLVGRIQRAFRKAFHDEPAGVWAAPGRINLIGEHVDYNQGLCLPFALAQRTYAAARPRRDGWMRVVSAQEPAGWEGPTADVVAPLTPGWVSYVVGVAWALQAAGHRVPGIDLAIDSQLPRGAGLSSSAALECATALALDDLAGTGLGATDHGRLELARVCARAENEIAGAPTGGLDQTAALLSRDGHAMLLDCRDFTLRQVPLDLVAAGLEVLVIDTRVRRVLVDGRYGERRADCRQACAALGVASLRDLDPAHLAAALDRVPDQRLRRRVRHVVTEIQRTRDAAAALDGGAVARLGPLLNASHASLRDDYQVSCPELDLACEVALAAGALGARLTGGGFGGCAIALVPLPLVAPVADAVTEAFVTAGHREPAFVTAHPAGPAERIGGP